MNRLSFLRICTISILGLLVFSACNPAQTPEQTEREAPIEVAQPTTEVNEQEPVTLTFWHGESVDPNLSILKDMSNQFMQKYPWITVNVEGFGFSEYFQKVDTAIAGGNAPDVFYTDVTGIATAVNFETIIPLTKYVSADYADDFFNGPKEDMFYKGELWAIPMQQSTEAIFYNKDIIEAAGLTPPESYEDPWTLDEFRSALEAVSKIGSDGSVEVWGYSTLYPPSVYSLQPYVYAHGGTFMDEAGENYLGYTNSQKSKEAFTYWTKFYTDKLAPIERVPDMFETGKVAFYQANPFLIVDLQQRYPDLNVGIMPMPCEEKCAVQSGAWHIGISSQSEHPDESWLLIDFLTNVEGHKYWIEESGYIPARISTYDALPQFKEYPWNIFAEGLINYAVHRPSNPAWPVFDNEMGNAITNVATGADPGAELDRVAEISQSELENYK